jgi:Icc-related predicted phosphoesterase
MIFSQTESFRKMHPQEKAVLSLLYKFQQHDFLLHSVNDGEEVYFLGDAENKLRARKDAADVICSVDESWVRIQNNQGGRATLFIVLGNDDSEILCDYSSSSQELMQEIDVIAEEFYQQWEKN